MKIIKILRNMKLKKKKKLEKSDNIYYVFFIQNRGLQSTFPFHSKLVYCIIYPTFHSYFRIAQLYT